MITGRIPLYKDVRCIDCATAYQMQWLWDMHNHAGKAYAAWEKTRGPQGRPRKQPPRR